MYTLSYIITSYNRPHLLERAVDFVIREWVADSELIVVDDHSIEPIRLPSRALEIFGDALTLVRNSENLGVIGARNAGVAASKGDFVIFLDDDDESLAERSRYLLGTIKSTGADFVAARAFIGQAPEERQAPGGSPGIFSPLKLLLNPPHIDAVIWRRSFLDALGGLDPRIPYFGEHVSLMLGLMKGFTGLLGDRVVARFSYLEAGLTTISQQNNRLYRDLCAYFDLLCSENPLPEFDETLMKVREMLQTAIIPTYDAFLEKLYECLGRTDAV